MGEVVYAAPQFGQHPARSQRVITTVARVLIVDADPAALAAISQALQSEGHHTATAFDATAAIAVAERLGPFELLITDLRMTPIDGLELAATLPPPRVSAAGDLPHERARRALLPDGAAHGGRRRVEKPFSEEELNADRAENSVKKAAIFLLLASAIAIPSPARAEGFISPLIGFNFAGDANCPTVQGCEDKRLNYGVALGAAGSVFGFEEEFAYARDFFGTAPI